MSNLVHDDPLVEKRYDEFADIYEITCQNKTDDSLFYLNQLRKLLKKWAITANVLEIGCGTGRVTLFLAKNGFAVTGIDISRGMLALADEKLKQFADTLSGSVELYRQDMRRLSLPSEKPFDYIVLPFGCLEHIFTAEDQEQTLQRIYSHLALGGYLIISVHNWRKYRSNHRQLASSKSGIFDVNLYEKDKTRIHKFSLKLYDPIAHIVKVWHAYDIYKSNSCVKERSLNTFPLKCIDYEEMLDRLRTANLDIVNVFGDYDLSDFSPEYSPRMIFIAKKSMDEPNNGK